MDYKLSDRLLFICASAGNGGHRLGRIVSCLDNVYWYSHKNNGSSPWDIFYNSTIKGKDISPYHYDRLTPQGMIPLVGERIEKYWRLEDYSYYYDTVWVDLMSTAGADQILKHQYLTWIVHDDPSSIKDRFPNSKIINLIDDDLEKVTDRYISTTALFPAYIDNKAFKPDYLTPYASMIEDIKLVNKFPTVRDVWAWEKYKTCFFDDSMTFHYRSDVNVSLNNLNHKKTQPLKGVTNVRWSNLDIEEIIRYLEAGQIDQNYIKLID